MRKFLSLAVSLTALLFASVVFAQSCPLTHQWTINLARLERAHFNAEIRRVEDRIAFINFYNKWNTPTDWRVPDEINFVIVNDALIGKLNFIYADCLELSLSLEVSQFEAFLRKMESGI